MKLVIEVDVFGKNEAEEVQNAMDVLNQVRVITRGTHVLSQNRHVDDAVQTGAMRNWTLESK